MINKVEGPATLHVRRVGAEEVHSFQYGSRPMFSNDNQWLAFAIGVSEEEEEKLEKAAKGE